MHPLCRAGDKRPASAAPFGPGERFGAVESPKVQQLLPQAPAGRQQARQGPASAYETAAAQGGVPASLLADTVVEVPPAAWPPYIAPEAALAGSKAVFDGPEGRRGGEAPQAVAAPKRVTGNAVPPLPAAKGMLLNALRQALSNGQAWARSCRQMQASLHPKSLHLTAISQAGEAAAQAAGQLPGELAGAKNALVSAAGGAAVATGQAAGAALSASDAAAEAAGLKEAAAEVGEVVALGAGQGS